MDTIEEQIKTINNKLQQLLKKNITLKKENEILATELALLKEQELAYKSTIESLSQKANISQALSGNIDKESKKELEKQINQYIRDLDKYINLLND